MVSTPITNKEQDWETLRQRLIGGSQAVAGLPQTTQGVWQQAQQTVYPKLQKAAAAGVIQPTSSSSASQRQKAQNPADTIRENEKVRQGQFYSDYPMTTIGKLSDPETAAREWAKFYKFGGDAYSQYMTDVFSDPKSMLLAMGIGAGKMQTMPDQLDWQRRLWDEMSGRTGATGTFIDPRNMISNVLNATYKKGDPAGSLGQMLNDPGQSPEAQVQNTIGILMNSLRGVLSDDTLNAYAATLKRLGQDFLSIRNKKPSSWGTSNTFNKYVLSQLGSGGGIY